MAGIVLSANFDVQTGLPLDSRDIVADVTARNALSSLRRYQGMVVHTLATSENWQLVGGITNSDWQLFAGGGGAGLPPGGTTGQVLTKLSNTDEDADWADTEPFIGLTGDVTAGADGIASIDNLPFNKLLPTTFNQVIASDGTGTIGPAGVTVTELNLLAGKTALSSPAAAETLTNKTINYPTLTVKDDVFTIQDNVDVTKQAKFEATGITTGTTATLTLPPATTTLVGTTSTQTLTAKTLTSPVVNGGNITMSTVTNTNRIVVPTGTAAAILALTATAGAVAFDTTQNKPVFADGTSWKPIGSGMGNTKNYLGTVNGINLNGDFELGTTTGWTLGVTGALTNGLPTAAPTFGSGAAGTLAITAVTAGKLSGNYSLSYASSAATTAGNMVASSAFTIDISDQARVLRFQFNYKASVNPGNANWSGTSANSFAWAVYDVTNASWIYPSGSFSMTQSSGVGQAGGTFQTSATGTSYRIVIFNANATTGAVTVLFDDFKLGTQAGAFGAVETDWVAYTPTFTGFGTASAVQFYWRRRGPDLFVRGTFTTGTVTAVEARVSFPAGLVASSAIGTLEPAGAPVKRNANSANFYFIQPAREPSTSYFVFTAQQATTNNTQKVVGSNLYGAGELASVEASAPIAGWASNVEMSSDSDTRVVAFRSTSQPTGTVNGSINIAAFGTPQTDTHGGYSAGGYIVQASGIYSISAALEIDATYAVNQSAIIFLYKNGVEVSRFSKIVEAAVGGMFVPLSVTGIQCSAGDVLNIRSQTSGGGSPGYGGLNCYFSLHRLSGPAVIAASETIAATFNKNGTQSVGAGPTKITSLTTVRDTHAAWDATNNRYMIPAPGFYQATTALVMNANVTGLITSIRVNGTTDYFVGTPGGLDRTGGTILIPLYLIPGDYIEFIYYGSGSPTLNATVGGTYFCVSRLK